LNEADLAELMSKHKDGPHWSYLGYLRVEALSEAGMAYPEAADLVAKMETQDPGEYWTMAARERLDMGARGGRDQIVVAEVNPQLVGVMAPLTGRYAVLGNAFYDAALLATRETNLNLGTSFEMQLEDTAADPVTSVLAVRKLCLESGTIAVMGGLLSAPTASAAVVCDFYGVPLLSPTATNASIWKVGPRVFQTNITGFYEARLLAELATTIMLKNRVAILHPDSPDGHRHAQVFTAEVESRGGKVVATAMFSPQGTDYKDQILELRASRPEVIFVPATVDQMVKLGPQLDFFKAGSLIMGLSNWNSHKLSENSATVLERAIFPDDLVLYERRWEDEFNRMWNSDIYPPEATAQALKAYQATRMLLETMASSGAQSRSELAAALARRLSSQDLELAGPQSYASTVRMFSGEKILPFPAEMFNAGWAMREEAMAAAEGDSTSYVPEDPWQKLNE
jgi:branched-chain amino acid transport system substrate-binding protein